MIIMNDMERDSIIKTLVEMCETMAKNIAERDGVEVGTVLADAYTDSGRDIWHETFDAVVKQFNAKNR